MFWSFQKLDILKSAQRANGGGNMGVGVCAFWKRVKIWQKFKNFWNFETGWTLKSSRIAAYTGCWLTFRKRCEISKKNIFQKVKKIKKFW